MKTGDGDSVLVKMADGHQAEVEGGQQALAAARRTRSHVVIVDADGDRLLVPAASITRLDNGGFLYDAKNVSQTPLEATGPPLDASGQPVTVPVIEEEISVSKRERVTGVVRLSKTVREEEALVDEPLMIHRVEVERVVVNRPISEIPSPRQEGDTLILPVVEEVLVVEKRLVLKEEVRVRRVDEETHKPERVTLRREEIRVERKDPVSQK